MTWKRLVVSSLPGGTFLNDLTSRGEFCLAAQGFSSPLYPKLSRLSSWGACRATLTAMSHTATCHLDQDHTHELPELDRRTREGLRAVGLSLGILGATALAQVAIVVASASVALFADLIHNIGDALTAVPVGIAFALRSARAERYAGLAVVLAILVSGIVAGIAAVDKLINPQTPDHLLALALAGLIGVAGNAVAARVRSRAGEKINSPALIADGHHARVDAMVSGGVVLSAIAVGIGFPIGDPLIALAITAVIGHIAWEAWETIQGRQ